MLRPSLLILLLLLSVLPACEVLGPGEGVVSARSRGGMLHVTNRTEARLYYFVVGRGTAATILWAPHLDQDQSIPPGNTAGIAPEDIFRSETEREVLVYWWHAVERDGQRQPGEIQWLVVRL